jgi:hypothetical protein
VIPCAVCTMHMEMRIACFLLEPQNQGRWFVSDLTLKPLGRFFLVWPQNRWQQFFQFGLKTGGDNFSCLASKPVVGFLVEPQNQGGGSGFPVLALK